MRIYDKEDKIVFGYELGETKPGDCIAFEKTPHAKHADGSIFMVLKIPSQYISHNERKPDGVFRIMVANLATGECSLMEKTRRVRGVDAEVIKNDA